MTEEIKEQIADVRHQVDEMLAIPAREIERAEQARRTALRFHVLTVALVLVGIVGVAGMAWDNRQATRELVRIEHDRVVELEEDAAELEDVLDQAVDEVVRLAGLLQDNGIDPGPIRIQPRGD